MPVQTFHDDDLGYKLWLRAHPAGWVVNAMRSPSPAYLKLHRARCTKISRLQAAYSRWTTGDYIKVCAERRDDLEAWARQTFDAELQGSCHCIQHGDRVGTDQTERMPAIAPAASVAASVLMDAEGFWTIETTGLIPFEVSDETLFEARTALRSVLGTLSAHPGEMLHGVVEGPTVTGTDLDNALLYNIGGRLNAAARYGVALERRTTAPGTGTRYRYRLTRDVDVPCLTGEPVVALDRVLLGGPPRAWPDVWAAIRTSDAVEVLAAAPHNAVGLHLRVGAPRFAGAATGQFIKTVVDGVMTALHAQRDAPTAAAVAERLATMIPMPADQIEALLVRDERAAMGSCQRLIVLRGQGVQCHPQDGRISALRIEIDRSASSWQLTGRVVRR
jgi:hypothetical protein